MDVYHVVPDDDIRWPCTRVRNCLVIHHENNLQHPLVHGCRPIESNSTGQHLPVNAPQRQVDEIEIKYMPLNDTQISLTERSSELVGRVIFEFKETYAPSGPSVFRSFTGSVVAPDCVVTIRHPLKSAAKGHLTLVHTYFTWSATAGFDPSRINREFFSMDVIKHSCGIRKMQENIVGKYSEYDPNADKEDERSRWTRNDFLFLKLHMPYELRQLAGNLTNPKVCTALALSDVQHGSLRILTRFCLRLYLSRTLALFRTTNLFRG